MKTSYTASIDSRFLEKVDRIFDASPRTVFDELLQNARRAQATEVFVTFYEHPGLTIVVFEDNGDGVDSPEPLLRLAGQGWDSETEKLEDPAGMGFFCLSNFPSVSVHSKSWMGAFTPAVFRGEISMETELCADTEGTRIRWEWPAVTVSTLRSALQRAAAYCGIERVSIKVEDNEVETVEPQDFLANGKLYRNLPDLGGAVAVFDDTSGYMNSPPNVQLNFYGVRVKLDMPYIPTEGDPLNYLCRIKGTKASVRVDVTRAGPLQLVLPARNALKHTPGREKLIWECERSLYEWIRESEKHHLSFEFYQRAKEEFNIDIGAAEFALMPAVDWFSSDAEKVLVANNIRWVNGFKSLFKAALSEGKHNLLPYCLDSDMEGYPWYDRMLVVEGMAVFLDGKEKLLDEIYKDQSDTDGLFEWVDTIKVVFTLSDGSTVEHQPLAIVAGEGDEAWPDNAISNCRVYVVKEAAKDWEKLHEVSNIVVECIFEPSDDSDCNVSCEDQATQFEVAIHSHLLEFVGDKHAAASYQLRGAVREASLGYAVADKWVWSLHYDKDVKYEPIIIGPHDKATVGECRKLAAFVPGNERKCGNIYELVSDTPVTHDRIEAFFQKECGYNKGKDTILTEAAKIPLDLDKWEKEAQP